MFKFQQNEGTLDRVIRFLASVGVFVWAYTSFVGPLAWFLYVVSIILLFTAITGFCGVYVLFGINTNKKK